MTTSTALTLGQAYNKQLSGTWPTSFYIPSNKLWSWGYNNGGQLGLNDIINRSSPVQVGTLTNWSTTDSGEGFTTGIKTDGTLWSWGQNVKGQLGDGTITSNSSPVQIGSLTNWLKVSSGSYSSIAISS